MARCTGAGCWPTAPPLPALWSLVVIVGMACFHYAVKFLPWSYEQIDWDRMEATPPSIGVRALSWAQILLGRDLLARVLFGGQVSLTVGILATFVALFIGVTV